MSPTFLFMFISILTMSSIEGKLKKKNTPPHCTKVTKDTDYISKFKLDYPIAYIPPGQHEAYQQMYCINPPAINKEVTVVCDWAAPPLVQFTLGDDYLHVVRQDPTGRYLGNAVITTYQLCSHNISISNDNISAENNTMANFIIRTVILFVKIYICAGTSKYYDIKIYEYGNFTVGDVLTFVYTGIVPSFIPLYNLTIKPNLMEVKNETFKYIRVQYSNSVSPVNINFNSNDSVLEFSIKYPFISFPYGIDGYSYT